MATDGGGGGGGGAGGGGGGAVAEEDAPPRVTRRYRVRDDADVQVIEAEEDLRSSGDCLDELV